MTKKDGCSELHGQESPNYSYVIKRAIELAPCEKPRVLDYGCGTGTLVAMARLEGNDFYGADTFGTGYAAWEDQVSEGAEGAIMRIENGRMDVPDEHFDVVVSNQVFEHIDDPPVALTEIARVLKPGGVFIALFPARDVWFEGHVGLYFVHWLSAWPGLQFTFMKNARRLGFGYYVGNRDPDEWARVRQKMLDDVVFYHSPRDIRKWWREVFGTEPRSDAVDYMLHRIQQSRLKSYAGIASSALLSPLLAFVCRVRAGKVLVISKPDINKNHLEA